MAKKTYTHQGKKIVEVPKLTKHQKQSADAGPIPWTKAPTTVRGKIARNLWG